ncbi:MAG: Mut7-C RNAse domain-containing protein [Candidatus Bipolaricaulaceae bacterium]
MDTRTTAEATFRFYGPLNDFLPPELRQRPVRYAFHGRPGVKDPIEALGVPHVEVELIVVAKRPVPFRYRLRAGDRVAVYPAFTALEVGARLRPPPPAAFVVDVHLHKLARILRLLGFDVSYHNPAMDRQLVDISSRQHRILLTRDRELLKHGAVTHGYWVRSHHPPKQAREVLRRFAIRDQARPFSRCLACGGELVPVTKQEVNDRIPPKTAAWIDTYVRCRSCDKLYWPGTHFARLRRLVADVLGPERPT